MKTPLKAFKLDYGAKGELIAVPITLEEAMKLQSIGRMITDEDGKREWVTDQSFDQLFRKVH
jgi:hypothetical protein